MPLQSRIVCFIILLILTITCAIIAWPWIHAACIWRHSTINTSDFYAGLLVKKSNPPVPRIIHQTYRNAYSMPLSWLRASNSCRTLHSNYRYYFWSDEEGRQLVKQEFPSLLSMFDSYPYNIQRADIVRLIILYIYGGVYLDLDIICLRPLDDLLNYDFVLPQTFPVGLSNDFIISRPRHPFLLQVINNLPKYNRNFVTKYPTVMFSTGPMLLTHEASSFPNRSTLHVLSPELYGKYAYNSSFSLFQHLKASSWHGSDASIVKSLYRWRYPILCLFISILLSIYIIMYIDEKMLPVTSLIRTNYSSTSLDTNNMPKKEQNVSYSKYVRIV